MSDAIATYGRRRTMRQHMGEEPPRIIVLKCLDAAVGVPRHDVLEILRYKCVKRGLDPGTSSGPRGWGWFPTIIANEIQARRDMNTAMRDPDRKRHWSEHNIPSAGEILAGISAFSTLDEGIV